jgi:DNA polymerase sigma
MKYENIKESLSEISDIDGQMKKLRSLCELEDDEINQREKIREFIENILKEFYPECTAHLFGSSVNGMGFKGSDIDVYFGLENGQDLESNIQRQQKMGRQILEKLRNSQKPRFSTTSIM